MEQNTEQKAQVNMCSEKTPTLPRRFSSFLLLTSMPCLVILYFSHAAIGFLCFDPCLFQLTDLAHDFDVSLCCRLSPSCVKVYTRSVYKHTYIGAARQ